MKILKYTAVFEPAEEGGYVVHVPVLDGLTTEGDTLEEARTMAEDAVREYIECLIERDLPVPEEGAVNKPTIEELVIGVK